MGINYFNVELPSWQHSVDVQGLLSHCYDGSIVGEECPACFHDAVPALGHFMSFESGPASKSTADTMVRE